MRYNTRMEEGAKYFWTLAKFQKMPSEDIPVMAAWGEFVAEVKRRMNRDDFSSHEIGELGGSENKFEHYKELASQGKATYQEEFRKELGLGAIDGDFLTKV